MIEKEDLMLGNWVDFDGWIYQVTGIEKDGVRLSDLFLNFEDIKPISLTEDILIINDFIKGFCYGENFYELNPEKYDFRFYVIQRKDGSWYLGREEYGITRFRELFNLDSVHQLQNFLKINKIKKEIKF